MSTLNVPIKIKRGTGVPANGSLKRGELAYSEDLNKLYIGTGDEVGGFAPSVEELLTPATVLEDLADVAISSGPNDGDVLTYDDATGAWIAQAVAAASVSWSDITGKPSVFAPDTHASSHHTGGADAIAPADIGAIPSSEKGANSGVATLDAGGKLETAQLPNLAITAFLGNAANEAAMLALTGQQGDWVIRDDTGAVWIITGSTPSSIGSWTQLSYPAAPVASVNGATGTVVLDHTDVGAAATSHTHAASDITSGLATVATTGAYSDLSGTPTLGTAAASATTDFIAASAASAFGLTLIDDADASAARTTLGLGSAATSASGDFAAASHTHGNLTNAGAIGSTSGLPIKTGTSGVLEAGAFGTSAGQFAEGNHTHVANDITNIADVAKTGEYSSLLSIPSTFTPSSHNHGVTVTLELSGFIEAPEAKTYVLSPSIPAAITITNIKAQTASGTCDIKLQDDGSDISNTTLDDVGSGSVAEPGTAPSASVAAGSKLALVVSDPSSSAPEDLAFSVYYTTTVTSANNT